jgi:hypothetical protein
MTILITDIDFNNGWAICDFLRPSFKFSKIIVRLSSPGVKRIILPTCNEYQAFEVEIIRQYFDDLVFYDSDRSPICYVQREKKLTFVRFNSSLQVLSVDDQLLW